jgi:phage terminase large subunit-like protein
VNFPTKSSALSAPLASMSWLEIVEACALDQELYFRTFFPRTFRQESPPFAGEINALLESPEARFVNLQLFRGSSKTTRSRGYMSRRVAYGASRVILCICASAAKAEMSVRWLKTQVQTNRLWTQTFGLRPGSKWTDWQIEIINDTLGISTWVLAFGLEGSHRGINIEDYRPDYIDIDDIIDEENAASMEQREKAANLVLGSLIHSLAPTSENHEAKMVIKQTPLHREDFSTQSLIDPRFHSLQIGCWTPETMNLPLEMQVSRWEERFPSTELRLQKAAFIARNKASIFAREMECRLTTAETSDFRPEWLRYVLPEEITAEFLSGMYITMAIDPVPPPSEKEIAKDLKGKDFECIAVVGHKLGNYYVLEYIQNRGHDPLWTIGTMFSLAYKWRPKKLVIETVAYQKTLEWLIREAMARQRFYIPIESFKDRRAKRDRINDSIAGPAAHGKFYVQRHMSDLISTFEDYPLVSHDDILDAISMAMCSMTTIDLSADDSWGQDEDDEGRLEIHRGCP